MKKDQQVVMNNYVIENYSSMWDEFEDWDNCVKLRSCQAWVYETVNYFVLKSYNTIVAFIDKTTGEKFDILRKVYGYTSTSAQHITKFFRDYSDTGIIGRYTYRDI